MRPIQMIPVDDIRVINPRNRSARTHKDIIDNISAIGLKRPITVSLRKGGDSAPHYDLVCGQGRLEAFQRLGHADIPAFVVEEGEERCLVMSLVENIARRQHSPIELMQEICTLDKRGYDENQIAQKLGVTQSWVGMVLRLFEHGEERLISAVETGLIPVSLAVVISRSDDAGIQAALADAYTQGKLKGKKLAIIRRILEQRAARGKSQRKPFDGKKASKKLSADDLRRVYEKEVKKQQLLAKKAEFTQGRLLFVVEAFRELLTVPKFVELLHAEGIDSLPKAIDDRMNRRMAQ
ncbi:plasmid stablization protein ParB [Stenotrophomonas terrae]|uniref:Plasmid stablization protein ParB n=1 Tax=Stenotrophomonas terrae TaxID=405446 RepID=A0A0R0CMY4_9GAMM|nr:plasmid partitioning protein RepB C-terminal domain-containing protein [Stenotrophomonas terrae]KRG71385.1 plasmid stablization protein ParB [Stenotrophomonas terrae]